MKLSILIPVYNERTVVERCISQVVTAPLPEDMDRELVIVDDCSTDGTSEILERLAAAFPQIRLHRHPQNRGKGAAVRTAIEKAFGDFALIQDADLEYDPAEYPGCSGHCSMAMPTPFLDRATWPASRHACCCFGTP